MYKNSKISNYQLFALLSSFMIGSSLIVSSGEAKQDAWLGFLIGLSGGIILLGMYIYIAKLNPSCTLVSILNKSFGKILGKVISILYLWYFIHLASLVLRNFGEFSLTTSYPETPVLFIIICLSLVVALAVRKGIEVIGRMGEIFVFILTVVLVFVFFAIATEFDVENLMPFLSKGMKPVLKSAFRTLTFPFGETVVFLMIFPYVNKQEKLLKASMASLIFVGIILLGVIFRNIMVLGPDMASRDIFPSHIVFRLIPRLDVEPLLDINLIVTGIIKIGICIYAAATGIAELLNGDDYKPFVIPIAAFAVSLSIWVYGNLMEMIQWAMEIWPYYSIPFQIVIPFILLIVSLFKNKNN